MLVYIAVQRGVVERRNCTIFFAHQVQGALHPHVQRARRVGRGDDQPDFFDSSVIVLLHQNI